MRTSLGKREPTAAELDPQPGATRSANGVTGHVLADGERHPPSSQLQMAMKPAQSVEGVQVRSSPIMHTGKPRTPARPASALLTLIALCQSEMASSPEDRGSVITRAHTRGYASADRFQPVRLALQVGEHS